LFYFILRTTIVLNHFDIYFWIELVVMCAARLFFSRLPDREWTAQHKIFQMISFVNPKLLLPYVKWMPQFLRFNLKLRGGYKKSPKVLNMSDNFGSMQSQYKMLNDLKLFFRLKKRSFFFVKKTLCLSEKPFFSHFQQHLNWTVSLSITRMRLIIKVISRFI